MKATIFGLLAVIAATHAGHVQYLAPSSFVRTPSLDSAFVQSERLNGAFSYSTVENHAYAPVLQSVPVVRYVYPQFPQIPQYPQVYYPAVAPPPVYAFHPGYYPTLSGIPQPGAPGVNPQNPIEVESPADNAPNDDYQQAIRGDEDTVSVESA